MRNCDKIKDLLGHTLACRLSDVSCSEVGGEPHCGLFTTLVSHWDECQEPDCVPNCGKSNEFFEKMINEWNSCNDETCSVCVTVNLAAHGKFTSLTHLFGCI